MSKIMNSRLLVMVILLLQSSITAFMYYRFAGQSGSREALWAFLLFSYISSYLATILFSLILFILQKFKLSFYFAALHLMQLLAAKLFSLDYISAFDYALLFQLLVFILTTILIFLEIGPIKFKTNSAFAFLNRWLVNSSERRSLKMVKLEAPNWVFVLTLIAIAFQTIAVLPEIWQNRLDVALASDLFGYMLCLSVPILLFKKNIWAPVFAVLGTALYMYAHNEAVNKALSFPHFLLTAKDLGTVPTIYWAKLGQQVLGFATGLTFVLVMLKLLVETTFSSQAKA